MFDIKSAQEVANAPVALAVRWISEMNDAGVEELASILQAEGDLDSALGQLVMERLSDIQAREAALLAATLAPPPPPPMPTARWVQAEAEDEPLPPTASRPRPAPTGKWSCPRDVKRFNVGTYGRIHVWLYADENGDQVAVVRATKQASGRRPVFFAHLKLVGLPARATREQALAIARFTVEGPVLGGDFMTAGAARDQVKLILVPDRNERLSWPVPIEHHAEDLYDFVDLNPGLGFA